MTYTYDNNGNTLTKVDSTGTTSYTWDYENRLASVTLPASGGTVSFKYDPFGRRIYKSYSSGTSVFAYDGANLVEETNATGALVARYEQTQNIDEPLAMLRSGTTSYYHADGLGSVTSLSSSAGSLAQTYGYDSFGKQTSSSGSLTNPFQYTARESDTETGLYYYRARYYDPSAGRFLSEDPIGFQGGPNFYAYVGNSSVNFADPLGLCQPTPMMKECLEKLFNEPIGGVKIDEKVDPKASYIATTRKNLIIIKIPCNDFLNDPSTVLEEYYHVLRQWNTGRLTMLRYGWEYLKHGYENNKYEIEAKKFANDHRKEYEKCLSCGE